MPELLRKTRILLPGNKLLGSLIYFNDKEGRPCIKFSFKLKVGQLSAWQERVSGADRVELEGAKEEIVSLDVSYKFDDSLLEVKSEVPGQKPQRRFVKVELPMKAFLFGLRVKNWDHLPEVELNQNSLLIDAPDKDKIYIVVSLEGENGSPYADNLFTEGEGKFIVSQLPRESYPKLLFFGVASDEKNVEEYDLTIRVPKEYPETIPPEEGFQHRPR